MSAKKKAKKKAAKKKRAYFSHFLTRVLDPFPAPKRVRSRAKKKP